MSSFYGSTDVVTSSSCLDYLEAIKNLVSRKQSKLMVVSDFDHTLTKFTSPQCHDIVGYNDQYPSEFAREFNNIFMRPNSSLAAWWTEAHDLITNKSGLTKTMLQQRLEEETIGVRDGLEEFAVSLRLHRVPLVIVSAGIRDVIAHTLTSCNVPTDADHLFHIDANYLEFHASGNIADILPKDPVHSESKKHVTTRAPHMFDFINARADEIEADITVATTANGQDSPSRATSGAVEHVFSLRSEDNSVFLMEPKDVSGATSDPISIDTTISAGDVPGAAAAFTTNGTSDTEVVAIVMGDRPADFAVLENYPQVATFRVGFARSHTGRDVELLLKDGGCDVVFVGEEHGLDAVHRMVDELIHLRNSAVKQDNM